MLFLAQAVHAEKQCPAEVKLLLSPPTLRTVTAALGFGNETTTRVYLFDTDALDLLMQGVIVRVRQGAKNDLTVKVRRPNGTQEVHESALRERFPCEIDRTQSSATASYAVARNYSATQVPEFGSDIYKLLSASQIKLLHLSQVAIDWARVTRIASISSTKWETTAQSPAVKLALELWEWPAGKVLELSTRVESDAQTATLAELERLVQSNSLSLNAGQDSKTNMVLETLAHASAPR